MKTPSLELHQRTGPTPATASATDTDTMLASAGEQALLRTLFPHAPTRREFIRRTGLQAALGLVGSFISLDAVRGLAAEPVKPGDIEKPDLSIGFIPITCATPIIMAEPMGFYEKNGLRAKVRRAAGWAVIRDWAINGEVDAAHMLSPMPLAITLGTGSAPKNFLMPAIENINGQALTLHIKHKDKVKGPQDMKGFRFCVPFDYSMHNYLLRYYLAEGGLDPDKDVSIRVVPPPEMVANLKADNVDGYLAPDPFNQRAVYEKAGFIFKLTKDIWNGHPCCGFAASEEFTQKYPNTFHALWRTIVEASYFSSDPANREAIAKAISPANYLNQPEIVVKQVLTGRYATGTGDIANVPDRIDFDPMPWTAMAKWILSQMVRWGQLKPDVDFQKIATQVYLEAGCQDLITSMGLKLKSSADRKISVLGHSFDAADPAAYARSFAIPAR
jgi:nitrate/nitrite transport system substrate-binding protein